MSYTPPAVCTRSAIISVVISDDIGLENAENEVESNNEFEYEYLRIATPTLMVNHDQLSLI